MKELSESRILIVDDVPANVDVLVQALQGDYQLSVAIDGTAALRSCGEVPAGPGVARHRDARD